MKRKKSILLVIAMVLGIAYMAYSVWYWFGGGAAAQVGDGSAEELGGAIATALVSPHLLLAFIAVVFNILGVATDRAGFALAAGILYAVAAVLFAAYSFFVIIQMVLCFVAFARMHKAKRAA